MLKIESGNKLLTSNKGHNSRLNLRNLPIYNPKPLLPNINSYTKFEENRSKNAQDRELKRSADGRTFEQDGIYVAMFSYFGYLCGYFPLRGLDTQETNLATNISNLRNKSHLYSKMNAPVSNCPKFIAT